jgi:glutathione S-transferase
MRALYHFCLSPFSRKVRIALREKGLDAELVNERVWERRDAFLALNPAGQVPVLVEPHGLVIADSVAICEYLDEVYPLDPQNAAKPLFGYDPATRAEVRRLVAWFDQKFNGEVTLNLVWERVMKRLMGYGEPDSAHIRAGLHNIGYHLEYIGYLTERRKWLAGDDYSLADIAAAAHLSCLDYVGDVPWDAHPRAKDWYARIKSRPAFRPLLSDHVAGVRPPRHYADLDF